RTTPANGLPVAPDPLEDARLTIQGGGLDLTLTMDGHDYQTYRVNFPPTVTPIPPVHDSTQNWHRYRSVGDIGPLGIGPDDVARSLSPADGDLRTIAYLAEVPAE